MMTRDGIYGALIGTRAVAAHVFGGRNYDLLAQAVATALFTWGVGNPANLALSGNATGTSGTGAIIPALSKVIVLPDVPTMRGALAGAQLRGPLGDSLATAMATGVAAAFAPAQYSGQAPSVGAGLDVSKITTINTESLAPILGGTMRGFLGAGPMQESLTRGLTYGIAGMLAKGTGAGTVVGSPTVPPTASFGPTPRSMVV